MPTDNFGGPTPWSRLIRVLATGSTLIEYLCVKLDLSDPGTVARPVQTNNCQPGLKDSGSNSSSSQPPNSVTANLPSVIVAIPYKTYTIILLPYRNACDESLQSYDCDCDDTSPVTTGKQGNFVCLVNHHLVLKCYNSSRRPRCH